MPECRAGRAMALVVSKLAHFSPSTFLLANETTHDSDGSIGMCIYSLLNHLIALQGTMPIPIAHGEGGGLPSFHPPPSPLSVYLTLSSLKSHSAVKAPCSSSSSIATTAIAHKTITEDSAELFRHSLSHLLYVDAHKLIISGVEDESKGTLKQETTGRENQLAWMFLQLQLTGKFTPAMRREDDKVSNHTWVPDIGEKEGGGEAQTWVPDIVEKK